MNCLLCDKELGLLWAGNTTDGKKVCLKCNKIVAFDLKMNLKKNSSDSIKEKYIQFVENKEIKDKPLNDIIERVEKLNPSASTKKEVKELPKILMDNEDIERVDTGYLKEGKGVTGHGLLVATNYRLIFIDKPTLGFGIKMEDFPYKNITSVSVETSFLKSNLKIICSGNTAVIDVVNGAKQLSEFIRQKTYALEHPKIVTQNSENDILGKIEKLAELKEKGILSEDEFATQKAKLLEQL